ncbi:MAG: polyhydroxyalkanoate synthesis regulator DNA-binding domain-containing protein [Micrococcales bacterium]|nr:polyhydroxyalkanoate synthesis regulator DNA-binding domain-containing protein [Micrococcales bacterium]MCL2543640.1 polyhydroxyalkanoate synthesis regulator DNA-binding domain-containing protein [Nocardioidaceae bacterium]
MPGQTPYVVKRYANRKLYDTVLRRFTTLDDVARLFEAGTQVVIRDHKTGADRTDEVLGQVLGRRVSRTPGGSDLLAGLLRAPAQIAMDVAGSLGDADGRGGETGDDGETGDEATEAKPASGSSGDKPGKKKKKSKTKGAGKSKSAGKAEPDAADDPDELLRRQQAEISELRGQVSELTQAVTLLLKEKAAELEDEEYGD